MPWRGAPCQMQAGLWKRLTRSVIPAGQRYSGDASWSGGPAQKVPPLDSVLCGRGGYEPWGHGSGEVRMMPPSMKKIMSMTLARLYRRWVGCPVPKSRVGTRCRSMIPACSW